MKLVVSGRGGQHPVICKRCGAIYDSQRQSYICPHTKLVLR